MGMGGVGVEGGGGNSTERVAPDLTLFLFFSASLIFFCSQAVHGTTLEKCVPIEVIPCDILPSLSVDTAAFWGCVLQIMYILYMHRLGAKRDASFVITSFCKR